MTDCWSCLASTCPLKLRAYFGDTWAKHLFEMATNISAARGIIDLTCQAVRLKKATDERETTERGRERKRAGRTAIVHMTDRDLDRRRQRNRERDV